MLPASHLCRAVCLAVLAAAMLSCEQGTTDLANTPPSVSLDGPAALTLTVDDTVAGWFTAVASDADNDSLALTWNVGPAATVSVSTSDSVRVVFDQSGSSWVSVAVSDGYVEAVDTANVAVQPYPNIPPVASLNVVSDTIHAPAHIRIQGSGNDEDGEVVRYGLEENGLLLAESETPVDTTVARGEGTWRYALTVVDDRDSTTTATDSVTVLPTPPPFDLALTAPRWGFDGYPAAECSQDTVQNVRGVVTISSTGREPVPDSLEWQVQWYLSTDTVLDLMEDRSLWVVHGGAGDPPNEEVTPETIRSVVPREYIPEGRYYSIFAVEAPSEWEDYDARNDVVVSDSTATIPACFSIELKPRNPTVMVGATQQFTPAVAAGVGTPGTMDWYVNSRAGGNAAMGTVDSTGNYTAPASVPDPGVVLVTAVSRRDSARVAETQVLISGPEGVPELVWARELGFSGLGWAVATSGDQVFLAGTEYVDNNPALGFATAYTVGGDSLWARRTEDYGAWRNAIVVGGSVLLGGYGGASRPYAPRLVGFNSVSGDSVVASECSGIEGSAGGDLVNTDAGGLYVGAWERGDPAVVYPGSSAGSLDCGSKIRPTHRTDPRASAVALAGSDLIVGGNYANGDPQVTCWSRTGYVSRVTPQGAVIWDSIVRPPSGDFGTIVTRAAATTSEPGFAYVVGWHNACDGGQTGGAIITVKIDANTGRQVWYRTLRGLADGYQANYGLAITPHPEGGVISAGRLTKPGGTDIDESDCALISYTAAGEVRWVRTWSHHDYHTGCTDLAVSSDGSLLFVSGYFQRQFTGAGPPEPLLGVFSLP